MNTMETQDSVVDPLRNPECFSFSPVQKRDEKINTNESPQKVEKTIPNVIPSISEELLHKIFLYSALLAEPGSKIVNGNECEEFWSDFFETHFKTNKTWMSITDDDLLYYVKKGADLNMFDLSGSNSKSKTNQDKFFVKRFDAKELPAKNDPNIDWECTQMLNVLLHHYQYTVEVSVRTKTSSNTTDSPETKKSKLVVLKKVTKKVYAVPSKIRMDGENKAEEVEYTYPLLYFAINDFDETWKDITLTKDGELVCVELFATGDYLRPSDAHRSKRSSGKIYRTRLFAGALDYSVIRREYKNKTTLFNSGTKQFFNLQGPHGKGAAEMAVQPQQEEQQQPQGYLASMKNMGSALKRFASPTANPQLNCSLATLCLRWDVIMQDLLPKVNK